MFAGPRKPEQRSDWFREMTLSREIISCFIINTSVRIQYFSLTKTIKFKKKRNFEFVIYIGKYEYIKVNKNIIKVCATY